MAKENSLDSWIDAERLEELIGEVRPGSLARPSHPSDVDAQAAAACQAEKSTDFPLADESLLPDEIPKNAFMKGLRPKVPFSSMEQTVPLPTGTATGTPAEAPSAEDIERDNISSAPPVPAASGPGDSRDINPLNLYFHSVAPTPEARARAFVTWVRETAEAASAFVVDGYGAAIAAEPETDSVFLASLSNLADALGRGRSHFSRPDQNALHLELEDGQVLCVVQAKWDVATVALGLIRERPLSRSAAIRYREELAKLAQKPRRRPRD